MLRLGTLVFSLVVLVNLGCSGRSEEPGQETGSGGSAEGPAAPEGLIDPGLGGSAERVELSAEECANANGMVVGDIGNGAIHRPDYVCDSGHAPIGRIRQDPSGPMGVEGSVCCPRP